MRTSNAAAQAAYELGEPWVEELCAYLDDNFAFVGDYLSEHLPRARYRVSGATYLAWVDLGDYFGPDDDLPRFFATTRACSSKAATCSCRTPTGSSGLTSHVRARCSKRACAASATR